MTKLSILTFLIIFFFLQSNSQSLAGYTFLGTYNGHTYYLSQTGYQWVDADKIARSSGGHLATISSDGENTFILNAITPLSISPWIGFNDLANKGTYVWSDGEPVSYTNWDINEPSNTGGVEDCAVIYYWNGKWNDGNPLTYDQFILEFDNNSCSLISSSLRNGLVAYYPFCGNAIDASGNDNDGVVSGATLTADRFGNPNSAYSFDGVSSKITIKDKAVLNPTYISVSLWYQTNDLTNSQNLLYKSNWNDASNEEYAFAINYQTPGQVVAGIKQNSSCQPGVNWQRIFSAINNNQWNHYVFTYDGTVANVYLNGNLITTNNSISGPIDVCPGGTLTIGAGWNGMTNPTGGWWNGKLDDILIYNRALNASEVAQLYQSNIVLPLTLENFSASLYNQQVKLSWNAPDEDGLKFFDVEKSSDGTNFQPIAQMKAGQKNYFYSDVNLFEKNFYRLKMTNINGSVSYSIVILVKTQVTAFEIYPNPTKNYLNIQLNASSAITVIKIQDQIGRLLKTINLSTSKGFNATYIDISYLHSGIYFISANGEMRKIIKE